LQPGISTIGLRVAAALAVHPLCNVSTVDRQTAHVAATSSLQFRAISNFGTVSATATTSCELTMIIEIEIGIMASCSLLVLSHGKGVLPALRSIHYLSWPLPVYAKTDKRRKSLSDFA
jgi:hypothetical protein